MPAQKITFGDMRSMGVRGVLVYCSDHRCSHSVALMADRWPDDVRLSNLEPRFVCGACGKRGADIRPNFSWNAKGPAGGLGYRLPAR
ncbi:hypothetical protein [Bradyrhizobium genosp. P]|uniref:hypothetical protein n=1 Tax=Bradyrhizobium genosp. P TaxID=83641 RepID=UPI003CE8DF58